MRAIKRYYTETAEKKAAYYKKCLDKALNENQKNETKLRFKIKEQNQYIGFMTNQNNALVNRINKNNDEYLALLNSAREYRSAMHHYREKMIEGAEKLQIYKNAVDEFIKRHPEFNEELKEIIKQEEEESEEAED